MKKMVFKSKDNQFGVIIDAKCVDDIIDCLQNAINRETGGILIGSYNEERDTAIVRKITGPPSDSKSGHSWFNRGVKGLQQLINKAWKERQYYLGEWHYHPNAAPNLSFCDKDQMLMIAASQQYNCPEPVLLIIGGSALDYTIKTFVVTTGNKLIDLGNVNHYGAC